MLLIQTCVKLQFCDLMKNYCTDQWTIIKYPAGSGGKFIGNCLFLFDKVAHWHGITGKLDIVNYFKQNMLDNSKLWLHKELNHRWNLNFYSRMYPRGNNILEEEFNKLIDLEASEYFHKSWENNFDIIDCFHKPILPAFLKYANSVTIVVDDIEIYKNLALSKLYVIDYNRNIITSLLDSPVHVATDNNKSMAKLFNNQYEFPLFDIDEFFETNVKSMPWLQPWLNINIDINKFTIKISELINYNSFVAKFQWFEDYYKQKIPRKYLIELHSTWSRANEMQYQVFKNIF